MPQLGETVTEGTVTRWFKAVGDTVARDEPLFEVSTDKVDSEVPSPAAGTLAEIRVPEGETVDVGTVLAVISEDGATTAPAAVAPAPAAQAPPAAAPAPAAEAPRPTPAPAPAPADQASPRPPAAPSPSVAAPAPPPRAEPAAPPPAGRAGLVLSPVVRRLLDEHGIDPSEIAGTGAGGRITRADVLAYIDARRAGGPPAAVPGSGVAGTTGAPSAPAAAPPAGPAATPAGPAAPAAMTGLGDEIVPFTNIRRRTAEHMVRSKATSAHTLVVHEADYEAVEAVRRRYGDRFAAEEGFPLTYLPFVARAVVEALHEWPHLNAAVGEDALVVHHRVNLSIAVDLSFEGLVAPVVHDADELTVRGLARRIRDLAQRARTKRLSPDDLAGGTFTITNPGPFGTMLTAPIINQPQVAILSTDTVKRRPVVVEQPDGTEAIAIRSVGLLSLVWDHRAVDGAYAAAFVRRVGEVLAVHDWASEL